MLMCDHPITNLELERTLSWVEHRSCVRCRHDWTVLFNIFNSDRALMVGEIRNYCKDGFYFETTQFVRPGTPLYLRILEGRKKEAHQNTAEYCRSISLAEVRWCRAIGDRANPGFGVGVKFYK